MSTQEELEMAISNCKRLILEAAEHSDRRRSLVNKLVQLRMRLLEAKVYMTILFTGISIFYTFYTDRVYCLVASFKLWDSCGTRWLNPITVFPKCTTQEGPVEEEPEIKHVVGHRFKARLSSSSKHYCEKCSGVIWEVVQNWYKCLGIWHGLFFNKCTTILIRSIIETIIYLFQAVVFHAMKAV